MAECVHFPEANAVLRASPTDRAAGTVYDAHAHVDDATGQMITYWKFSPEEIELIRKQGGLYVAMLCRVNPPPIAVRVESPFYVDPDVKATGDLA